MEGGGQTPSADQNETLEIKDAKVDKTGVADDLKITVDDSTGKEDNKDREAKDEKIVFTVQKVEGEEREDDEKKDVEKPLIDEREVVSIDLGGEDEKIPGEDTPTLPLPDKKKPLPEDKDKDDKEKPPSMFLHPIDTLRYAWKNSKSIPEFFLRAICIIFASLGWVFCVGGVPLLPLVMLIIGCIFIHDCPVQPKIPVYLVVAGLFGLIQHVSAIVTKYLPKDKRGIIEAQQRRCMCLDGMLQTFLFVWFIAGCVWVYSIYEPEYRDKDHPEYCHKTVYLFTFWMFNVSFIILLSIIAFAFCVILYIVTSAD